MKNRYVVEEGYFGVWESFKSFRFYWSATREAYKQERGYGGLISYRVIDTKTGETA